MVLLKFVLSCDILWGYFMIIDPDWFVSMDAIVRCVIYNLQSMLRNQGLDVLFEKTKNMHFHIHDHTLESLRTTSLNSTIYICDHSSPS